MTASRPNNDYNWGYALTVGVNKLSNQHPKKSEFKNLTYCVDSAANAVRMLNHVKTGIFYKDYNKIIPLVERAASYINVVKSILLLASETKPGDAVTLTFSCHGDIEHVGSTENRGSNQNYMVLYDDILYEAELFFLLKFFKPQVKIYLIFDMCQSGSWISSFSTDYYDLFYVFDKFEDKIRTKDSELADYMVQNNTTIMNSELPSTICIIAGATDNEYVNDKNNAIFFLYQSVLEYSINKPPEFMANFEKWFYDFFKSEDGRSLWYNTLYTAIPNPAWIIKKEGGLEIFNLETIPAFDVTNPQFKRIADKQKPFLSYIGSNADWYNNAKIFGV